MSEAWQYDDPMGFWEAWEDRGSVRSERMTLWKTVDGVSLDTLADEASPTDLLAELRRLVESGTIKGAEVWRCNTVGGLTCRPGKPFHADKPSDCGYRLVIPLCDGGSET